MTPLPAFMKEGGEYKQQVVEENDLTYY